MSSAPLQKPERSQEIFQFSKTFLPFLLPTRCATECLFGALFHVVQVPVYEYGQPNIFSSEIGKRWRCKYTRPYTFMS